MGTSLHLAHPDGRAARARRSTNQETAWTSCGKRCGRCYGFIACLCQHARVSRHRRGDGTPGRGLVPSVIHELYLGGSPRTLVRNVREPISGSLQPEAGTVGHRQRWSTKLRPSYGSAASRRCPGSPRGQRRHTADARCRKRGPPATRNAESLVISPPRASAWRDRSAYLGELHVDTGDDASGRRDPLRDGVYRPPIAGWRAQEPGEVR